MISHNRRQLKAQQTRLALSPAETLDLERKSATLVERVQEEARRLGVA